MCSKQHCDQLDYKESITLSVWETKFSYFFSFAGLSVRKRLWATQMMRTLKQPPNSRATTSRENSAGKPEPHRAWRKGRSLLSSRVCGCRRLIGWNQQTERRLHQLKSYLLLLSLLTRPQTPAETRACVTAAAVQTFVTVWGDQRRRRRQRTNADP